MGKAEAFQVPGSKFQVQGNGKIILRRSCGASTFAEATVDRMEDQKATVRGKGVPGSKFQVQSNGVLGPRSKMEGRGFENQGSYTARAARDAECIGDETGDG